MDRQSFIRRSVDFVTEQAELQRNIAESMDMWEESDRLEREREVEAEKREQWYESAGEEAIIERVYESYARMAQGLSKFGEELSEEAVSFWMANIEHANNAPRDDPQSTIAISMIQDFGRESYVDDYKDEAGQALYRMMEHGIARGDLSQTARLVIALRDPVLANQFLERINNNLLEYSPALMKSGIQQYLHGLRKELMSDQTGVTKALLIGFRVLHPYAGAARITDKNITKPVKEIACYPKVQYQILGQVLHGQPLELTAALAPVVE